MADLYCDHGAHGFKASFNGTFNGWSVTVNSVASGKLSVGSHIYGPGVLPGTYITDFQGGSGGTGNYSISRNQTLGAQALTADMGHANATVTPTWGVAQEGDGTAPGLGAPAMVSINLAAASASAGSFGLLGATVSCSGSGSALVASIVSAINSSSALTTALGAGWATPQLRDAVYARVGSPNTTLEIMTRAASAAYNGLPITTAGFSGGTFGPYSFSGGVGGCWSWIWSSAKMWPSQVEPAHYGIFSAKNTNTNYNHRPLAGAPAPGDSVWIRCGKKFYLSYSAGETPATWPVGTRDNPVKFIVDVGAQKWPADSGLVDKQISVYVVGEYGDFAWYMNQYSYLDIDFPKINATTHSFALIEAPWANNYNNSKICVAPGGAVSLRGLELRGTSRWNGAIRAVSGIDALFPETEEVKTRLTEFVNVKLAGPMASVPFIVRPENSYTNLQCRAIGLTIDNSGASSAHTGIFGGGSGGNNSTTCAYLDAPKFKNFVPGSKLFDALNPDHTQGDVWIRNPAFGNVNDRAGTIANALAGSSFMKQISITSNHGRRDFRHEGLTGSVEWNSLGSYPTCTATDLEGLAWSIKFSPSTSSRAPIHNGRPLMLPRLAKKNTLGEDNRTLRLELLLHKSITSANRRNLVAQVEYLDADGEVQVCSSSSDGALLPSTATWTNMQTDPADGVQKPTYVDGGTQFYERYYITVVTPTSVADNTEMGLYVKCGVPVTTAVQSMFLDPAVLMS